MAHVVTLPPWYRRMFVGTEGLRHGWRFVLFALALWLLPSLLNPPIIQLCARLGIDLEELSAPSMIVTELVILLEVLAVTFVAALLEGRRVDDYGLPVRRAF